ncbi:MAG: carbohydrate ABC transporter permease [Thermotoga sp.]|nr:carbohydrate ABC transporter permease [Thermotogota bacterium]RKX56492.1 MAG: carbohydrate ABC transporter permease [Thermotoga sp.]
MNKNGKRIITIVKYIFLFTAGFLMILPFYWLVAASLMTPQEFISMPPKWIPHSPQWHNYVDVFKRIPMWKYYMNSLIVSTSVTLLVLITSALAGYSFAKLRFAGNRILFRFVLATMMFPAFLFLIPVFYLMKQFGWLHSRLSLITPFIVSGYGIFLLRQFIVTIPNELLDVAKIDGASQSNIFSMIILPLAKPALATLGILTFIGQWNSFMWPLIITSSAPEIMTIPVGLSRLSLAFSTLENQNLILAGLVLQVIPVVVLFLYLQRYYIKGIVLSGFGGI